MALNITSFQPEPRPASPSEAGVTARYTFISKAANLDLNKHRWRVGMSATYRDVKADILSKIVMGTWAPGSLLPNETDLAESYACARATVNRAMRELVDDGIIERKRKAGTRVRQTPVRQARFNIPIVRREIEALGAQYDYTLVSKAVEKAPDWLCKRLKLETGSKALHIVCRHAADGIPYQFEDRWINLALLPQAKEQDFSEIGPNEWLVSTIPYSDAEISFSAGMADDLLAGHLQCATGDALFVTERSTWWQGQAITFVCLTFQRGHKMTATY